jgi:hypothetical protein
MERLLAAQPSRLAWASTVAVMGALVAACGGSVGTSSPPGSQALGSPGATASPSQRSSTPTAAQSPLDPLDFDITGSIGGKQVVGKLTNGSFTVPCVGAGQVLVVHWAGTASQTSTQLHGEIDFKPGSWTIGSPTAQGTVTVGLLGGKAADALGATSGTVTTVSSGGTIDAMFTNGPGTIHLSGAWTCPAGSATP